MKRAMWPVLAAACVTAMPGCLITSNSNTQYSGRYIEAWRLDKIEPGRSTSDDVLEELGEPTHRSENTDGSEVWRYEYAKTRSSSGAVFLLFAGSSRKETSGEVQVTVKDGVVQRVWRDSRGA